MKRLLCLTGALLVSFCCARADDLDLGRLGHAVAVTGEFGEQHLTVDGRSMLDDAIVNMTQVVTVGGVPALVGERGNGGNLCDVSPFVVAFPAGDPPRLDGPLDSCAPVTMEPGSDRLLFSTEPIPGRPGERWSWTPAEGFKSLSPVAFQPDSGAGWKALRERRYTHPADVFSNGAIAKQIDTLLGPDKADFEHIITGVGGGEFKGDDFVGTACMPHMCTVVEALLYLSADDRTVYLAWKPENEKIIVRPPVGAWPHKARLELKDWASKWK